MYQNMYQIIIRNDGGDRQMFDKVCGLIRDRYSWDATLAEFNGEWSGSLYAYDYDFARVCAKIAADNGFVSRFTIEAIDLEPDYPQDAFWMYRVQNGKIEIMKGRIVYGRI